MSDRFERFAAKLLEQAEDLRKDNIKPEVWTTLICVAHAARETEAQPEPGAVPELPEWVEDDEQYGRYLVAACETPGVQFVIPAGRSAEDYDRIETVARILAARERARRAQS